MTLPRLAEKKRLGEPIVMVTAYDYPSARAAEAAGVDLVLVGDSRRDDRPRLPVDRRRSSSTSCSMLAKAARRGLRTPFLVGDLPFGSYEVSDEQAVADRLPLRQGGGLRRGQARGRRPDVRSPARGRSSRAGIPVMGHVGLTPQTSTALGGYQAQGRDAAGGRADRARGARPAGGRLLLDRLRGDPQRGRRGAHAARWRSR